MRRKNNKIVKLARSKLNSIESKIFLMKKRNIENWKKALEWWIVKEMMLRKLVWLIKVKKIGINQVIKRNEIINNSLK